MANYLFLVSADAERIFINGKDFLKGDVFAKPEGDGFRLYAKDPLYPITTHLSIHTAAKLVGDVVTPFANEAALETWVEENVLNIGNFVGALDDFELVANKATTFDTINDSLYPTTQAVVNYVGSFVVVPAPPTTGTKMLVSTDGVLSWEDIPA